MILIVDNYVKIAGKKPDTKKFTKLLDEYNIQYKVIQDIDRTLDKSKIKGIILSGSHLKLTRKINFDNYIHSLHYLFEYNVPVLGICFGCQLLHMLYGGNLKDTGDKYFCKSSTVELSNHKLFKGVEPSKDLHFCFSDLILPSTSEKIKELAWFNFKGKRNPCAFEYKNKIFGFLFHPESLEESKKILLNFYNVCLQPNFLEKSLPATALAKI
jgi:GMP synthase-like glutamine amidotransferase